MISQPRHLHRLFRRNKKTQASQRCGKDSLQWIPELGNTALVVSIRELSYMAPKPSSSMLERIPFLPRLYSLHMMIWPTFGSLTSYCFSLFILCSIYSPNPPRTHHRPRVTALHRLFDYGLGLSVILTCNFVSPWLFLVISFQSYLRNFSRKLSISFDLLWCKIGLFIPLEGFVPSWTFPLRPMIHTALKDWKDNRDRVFERSGVISQSKLAAEEGTNAG